MNDTVAIGYLDDGNWKAVFGLSKQDLLMHDLCGDQKITCHKELRIVAHPGGLAHGRNRMMRAFLDDTSADWLFMVDSDMGFDQYVVDNLLASAKEHGFVMGGLCFAMSERDDSTYKSSRYDIIPTIYEYASIKDKVTGVEHDVGFVSNEKYPRNTVVRVAATGTACLLIHRNVGELIRQQYDENWFSPTTHPTGDNGRPRIYSEDFSFFLRCAQAGIPAFVDTAVKTVHVKGALNLDEDLYDDYRLAERTTAEPGEGVHGAPAGLPSSALLARD